MVSIFYLYSIFRGRSLYYFFGWLFSVFISKFSLPMLCLASCCPVLSNNYFHHTCTCSIHTADCTMRDFNTFFVGSRSSIFYICAIVEVVCRVHSEGSVEEHRQFWVLVAGKELAWQVLLLVVCCLLLSACCWEGAVLAGIVEKDAKLNKNTRF